MTRRSLGWILLVLPALATGQQARQQFLARLSDAAIERTRHQVRYVPDYVRIPYPGGDVPAGTGVCTDEVIRSYRALGIDLQKEVYQFRKANSTRRPDPNIDHRRVPNLQAFFAAKGETLPVTARAGDYSPGDLVTWDLSRGVPHIGIVVARRHPLSGRYQIVHNIGQGPRMEDVLFSWKITGHYRYFGPAR